jgi:uncharacterized membrane protein YozB (DUF420 family)
MEVIMRKFFWKVMGWATFPGWMYACRNDVPNEPIRRIESRQSAWVVLGLTFIATVIYGAVAIYFGLPRFRGDAAEILSPLTGLVFVFNFLSMLAVGAAFLVGNFDKPEPA